MPSHAPYLPEGLTPEPEPIFIADDSVTSASLRAAAQMLIDGFPATLTLPKVEVKKIMSLEEMIGRMATRIGSAFSMSFKEFSKTGKGEEARHHMIVSFLALLELVKQGIIKATQEGDDIRMESDAAQTPRYE